MTASAADTFEAHRAKLTGLAYRMTGSRAEAEDIVQETCLRWLDADQEVIESPRGWLVRVATRLALDYLKSARVTRLSYVGPWLPEPFVAAEPEGASMPLGAFRPPDEGLDLDESISMALLVLLEKLSGPERACFILHDLFHFSFEEVGEILERSGSSCRKLASRARTRIGADRRHSTPDRHEHVRMVSEFFNAVKNGDLDGLVALLKENAAFHTDGGGKAAALPEILRGARDIAAFLVDVVRPGSIASDQAQVDTTMTWFNGSPGLVVWLDGKPVTAFNFEITDGQIETIHALRNPDKLRLFGRR